MPASTEKIIFVFFISFALLSLKCAFWYQNAHAQSMLPAEMVVKKIYQAGSGLPLGKVQSIWGDVVIVHAGAEDAYRAGVGLPLFRGDTIITNRNASFSCRLKDGSTVKLSENSKLKINLSTHDNQRKSSISSLALIAGKSYFQIATLKGFDPREFKVETESFIAGGRQAHFAIFILEAATEIITFKDSLIEVMSLDDPDQKIFLSEFQRAEIEGGELPSTVEIFPEQQARRLLSEFRPYSEDRLSSVGTTTSGAKGKIADGDLQDNAAGRGTSPGEFP
jgi:hypothetical protein